MRGVALLVLASCGGGWKPIVWTESPADPAARPVSIEFPDGTNSTALLMKLLADAKAAEVSGISKLELQVGPCTREIAIAPRKIPDAASPQTERIVVSLVEKKLSCGRTTDQQITHAPTERGSKPGFGDAQVVTHESCSLDDALVTSVRYRFEVEHAMAPPDFDVIAAWSRVRLVLGAPRCAGESRNELRAVFHRASGSAPMTAAIATSPATTFLELVARSHATVDVVPTVASSPTAGQLAEQALALIAHRDPLVGADDVTRNKLLEAIALAHALVIETDVQRFMARAAPADGPLDTWASEVGADIDRVAKRYERIKDVVRVEQVGIALRHGALRLAAMHEHAARMLDARNQPAAAEAERAKARALRDTSGATRATR